MQNNITSEDLPVPTTDRRVTLQVGERQFITTRTTLMDESGFFTSLLSDRWDNAQTDGSYFIDSDPDLFEHILRYLRTGVLPIFYDRVKGHDYALYLALLGAATYFQIVRLQEWIETQQYLRVLTVKYSVTGIEGIGKIDASLGTDVDITYYPAWGTEKVYVCPRGIYVHRGNPNACGKDCRKAQGDADDIYDEKPILRILAVKKQIVFNVPST